MPVTGSQIGLNGLMLSPWSTKLMYSRIRNGSRKKTNSQTYGTPMTKRLPGMGSDEVAIQNLQ